MQLFLISDMDGTLTPFKHTLALLKVKNFLESQTSLSQNAAEKLCQFAKLCRENLTAQIRGLPHDQRIVEHIEKIAHSVQNKGDWDMRWSREVWFYAAYDVIGEVVSAQFAVMAADKYWEAIGHSDCLYEDVKEFFDSLWWRNSHWNLIVVTSSDLRLRASEDGARLVYDPEHSYLKKFERVPLALNAIASNNLFIGDPRSKPHPSFWEKVVTNIGYNPEEDAAVMIGDMPSIDLTGLPRGFVPILIDRDKQIRGSEVKEARYIIHGFDALPIILENLEKQVREEEK